MNDYERELQEQEKKQAEWEAKLRVRKEKQIKWEERANKSKEYADCIANKAASAEPVSDSAFGEIIMTVATGGLYAIAEAMKSPKEIYTEKTSYLKSCSKKLNEARDYFYSHKNDMIAEDKNRAFSAISSSNEKLKSAWVDLNNQKQKAWESYKRAKEEKAKEYAAKKAAWEERQRIKAEKQKLYEEKKKAWEDRQRIKAQKQKEWEERNKERERKQKEWEERKRERERKQMEWEERQRERERKREEYEERKRNRGGGRRKNGGCYITTATCLALSKSDDCFELSVIRHFRDNWLAKQKNGIEIINEYYKIAPVIVENININNNRIKVYKEIWDVYLKCFFELIMSGNNKKAKVVYLKMVDILSKEYLFKKN